MKDNRHYDMLA